MPHNQKRQLSLVSEDKEAEPTPPSNARTRSEERRSKQKLSARVLARKKLPHQRNKSGSSHPYIRGAMCLTDLLMTLHLPHQVPQLLSCLLVCSNCLRLEFCLKILVKIKDLPIRHSKDKRFACVFVISVDQNRTASAPIAFTTLHFLAPAILRSTPLADFLPSPYSYC